ARPFTATHPFIRTANRHDYSIEPSDNTMLDLLVKAGKSVIALGKISDIFATRGVSESILQSSNDEGMDNLIAVARRDFEGLCFLNLVDFDSKYGHRNDADGYAKAVTRFDQRFNEFINSGLLSSDDIVIVTADHGCDPSTPSTDHSREYAPVLVSGKKVKNGVNLGVRSSFADISATILQYFGVDKENTLGKSFLSEIL
ncbi:MAG: phosphopentomutase, partial [Clostridia bacterium]|nr:phosphopentomutase [Clostridia bacterium]